MARSNTFIHQIGRLYSNLFPHPCFLCGAPASGCPVCSECISDLPLISHACKRCAIPISSGDICGQCLVSPPRQTEAFSLFRYESLVKKCVTAYKYQQQLPLGVFFSELMASHLRQRESLPEVIIPIPLHPNKIKQRGFNQSALLAKQLSKQLGIAFCPNALTRVRDTHPQYDLNLSQRQKNLQQAFHLQSDFHYNHVALIDDVMTTGTTVNEAAKTLNKNNILNIEVWTIARAISHY